MADPFVAAVRTALAASGPLVAALGSAPVGGGPAIYVRDPVPENTELPYVIVRGPVAASPFDTKVELNDGGRDLTFDVNAVAEQTGDVSHVQDVANLMRTALHRQPLVIVGYQWVETQVFGPTPLEFEDVYVRNLTVQVLYVGT